MSVAGPERLPHLFVVDSQAPYAHLPVARHSTKPSARQMLLRLLGVFVLLAVFVEGGFIVYLYGKIQGGNTMSEIGAAEPTRNLQMVNRKPPKTQQKPSAHLTGTTGLQDGIMQWTNLNSTSTFTYQMGYKNGRLMVQVEGLYYLYSKVYLDLSERCPPIQLMMIMRETEGYPKPIELLRSSSTFSCHHATPARFTVAKESVLGGLFHLKPNDKVYVKLSTKPAQSPACFLGAFMLY